MELWCGGWASRSRPIFCLNCEDARKRNWASRPRPVHNVPPCCDMKTNSCKEGGTTCRHKLQFLSKLQFVEAWCTPYCWIRKRLAKIFPVSFAPPVLLGWESELGSALHVLPGILCGQMSGANESGGGVDPYYRQTRGAPLPSPGRVTRSADECPCPLTEASGSRMRREGRA